MNAIPLIRRAALVYCLVALAVGAEARGLKPFEGDYRPPSFSLSGVDGKHYDLDRLTGYVVLVKFWATWCTPCLREMDSLDRLQARFADRRFIILGVNMGEDEASIRKFLDSRPVHFPVLIDGDGKVPALWQAFACPSSALVGPDGRIRYTVYGEMKWDSPEVTAQVKTLLSP